MSPLIAKESIDLEKEATFTENDPSSLWNPDINASLIASLLPGLCLCSDIYLSLVTTRYGGY